MRFGIGTAYAGGARSSGRRDFGRTLRGFDRFACRIERVSRLCLGRSIGRDGGRVCQRRRRRWARAIQRSFPIRSLARRKRRNELAAIDRGNLDRYIVAQRFRIAFEQQRKNDRGRKCQHDRSHQPAAGASLELFDGGVGGFGSCPHALLGTQPARRSVNASAAATVRNEPKTIILSASATASLTARYAEAGSAKARMSAGATPAASRRNRKSEAVAPRGGGKPAMYQRSTRGSNAAMTLSMSLSAMIPNTAHVRG